MLKWKALFIAAGTIFALTGSGVAYAAVSENQMNQMEVTLYGARDNDPPGSADIKYPGKHQQAGGVGTYSDPVTFASNKNEFAPGTVVYYPYLKKYFIMEDVCGACSSDWNNGHKKHIDLWAGNSNAPAIIDCENKLTRSNATVFVNPAKSLRVDTTPIFDPQTNQCYSPQGSD